MASLPRLIFSLKPEDIELLDKLQRQHGLDTRAAMIRKLIRDASKEKPK